MDRTSRSHKRHHGNRKITYKTAGNAEITVIHDETAPKEPKNVCEVIFQGNKEAKKYPLYRNKYGEDFNVPHLSQQTPKAQQLLPTYSALRNNKLCFGKVCRIKGFIVKTNDI